MKTKRAPLPVLPEDHPSVHRRDGLQVYGGLPRLESPPPVTKQNPIIISASEVRDWLRCRQKHAWRYHARLQPSSGSTALSVGTLVHEILEAWYARPVERRTIKGMTKIAGKAVRRTTLAALSEYDRQLVEAMTIGYAAWAKKADKVIGLTTCTPELPFLLPLTSSGLVYLRGKIDNVFEPGGYGGKVIASLETKTRSQIRQEAVETNFQLSTYLWALRQLFPKRARYVSYFQILRKQMPTARVRSELFYREEVERTDEELEMWAQDVERIAFDMHGAAIYPNPQESCSWECDFRMPCLLRGLTDDVQHVLETGYIQRERRDDRKSTTATQAAPDRRVVRAIGRR